MHIRKDLSPGKQSLLTTGSFLIPLFLWTIVSYAPFIWHPDIKLQVSADRSGVTTVFTAGDRVSKEFFPTFSEAIRVENQAIMEAREQNKPIIGSRRDNLKKLRHLAPLAVANGWLEVKEQQNDEKLYGVWKGLAEGSLKSTEVELTEENIEVIRSNWRLLSAYAPTYDSKRYPTEAMLKLIPQGVSSNPVYLPAPHEVIQAGWRDFTTKPDNDMPTMWERYRHSLTIIFWGFTYSLSLIHI